ncbi:MAG: apolipoprotein N-acyltransferase, partial [Myxococcales bacterium]|nr:apolipoprotein N-acyltransferase [Myxococcales bacterium]
MAPTSAEGREAEGREAAAAPTSPEARRAGQPLSGRVAYGLAALSGLLYALACPGFDAWPLALVAQVPLILALRGQTPKRATGLGWVAGLVMCVVGFYWLRELLITFAHLPVPLPSLGMVVVAAYQAGRMALVGLVFGLATRRGWPPLPVFAAAFISAELVYPELFPWYYAGCVHNALPLLQLAEYGGVFLVGALLLAPNLAIAAVLQSWLDRKAEDRPPLSQRLVGAGLLAPILLGGWGLFRIGQIRGQQEEAKSVRVALIQPNMPLVDRKGSLEKHQQMTAEARKKRPELVIWNEG